MNLLTIFIEWEKGNCSYLDERRLFDAKLISECEFEFGPHDNHDECDTILSNMNPDLTGMSGLTLF